MRRLFAKEPRIGLVRVDPLDRVKGIGLWGEALQRLARNRSAMLCTGIILVYLIVAGLVALRLLGVDDWKYEREVPPGTIALLSEKDVLDWPALIKGIQAGEGSSPEDPKAGVWSLLPDDIKKILPETAGDTEIEKRRRDRLITALNSILLSPKFADVQNGPRNVELQARHNRLRKALPNVFGPVRRHWLGTNWNGTDVLTLTIYGTKAAISVAIMSTVISIAIGVFLGAVSGYFGGIIDDITIWLYTTFQSIPGILLIIAFAVVLKDANLFGYELSGLPAVYIALGVTGWVGICRLIRGEVLKHREQEYVQAARAFGMGRFRIIFRHILPNTFHLVIITFSLGFLSAIHTEVILTYLGIGAKDKTWGTMINNATQVLSKGIWWEMAAATVAIFIISLALNILGDALSDALDPKLRK